MLVSLEAIKTQNETNLDQIVPSVLVVVVVIWMDMRETFPMGGWMDTLNDALSSALLLYLYGNLTQGTPVNPPSSLTVGAPTPLHATEVQTTNKEIQLLLSFCPFISKECLERGEICVAGTESGGKLKEQMLLEIGREL